MKAPEVSVRSNLNSYKEPKVLQTFLYLYLFSEYEYQLLCYRELNSSYDEHDKCHIIYKIWQFDLIISGMEIIY